MISFITPSKLCGSFLHLAHKNQHDFGNQTMTLIDPLPKLKIPLFVSIFLVVKQIIHPLSDIDDIEFQVTHAEFINFRYPNLKYFILFLVILSDAYIMTTGWQNTFFYNLVE